MKQRARMTVVITTLVLIIYCFLQLFGAPMPLLNFIFFLSPFLVIWMVYDVIRFDTYRGVELKEGEEWGYADKNRSELGMF